MKTIQDKIQYQIAQLCCRCYDLGKNDGTLDNLKDLLRVELNYEKEEITK